MTTAFPNHEARIVALALVDESGADCLATALARGVRPDHFEDPACREIFRAALDLHSMRRPVSVHGVAELLRDRGDLEKIGGWPALADRTGNPPTSAHLHPSLDRLLAAHALRCVATHCRAAAELAESPAAGDLAARLDEIHPHLRAAAEAGTPAKVRDLRSIAESAAVDLESAAVPGLPGPFPSWDRGAGAILPGELIVLAARPGVGKTALALQFATACFRAGKRCVVFSLEMSGEELVQRLARQHLGPHATRRDLAAWIRAKLTGAKGLAIFDGASGATLAQIEARSRLLASHPAGLGLIVVDYLQLVAPPPETRRDIRERQVAALSRGLKLLAGELRVPVLLLAQLNRENVKEERRPRLTDLRESGAVEQDADACWFLHPDTSGPSIPDAERVPVLLIQAKRRNGPAGIAAALLFERAAVRFTPAAADAA